MRGGQEGLGVGSQPLGHTRMASSGGHGAPPAVGLETLPQSDTDELVDRHYSDILVHRHSRALSVKVVE
jgi:hypothetical protein